MPLATRCPSCDTAFRLVRDQLLLSGGWVRCGRCGQAFDATATQFEFEAPAAPDRQTPPEPPAEGHPQAPNVAASESAPEPPPELPPELAPEPPAEPPAELLPELLPEPPPEPPSELSPELSPEPAPELAPDVPPGIGHEGEVLEPAWSDAPTGERWLDDLGDFHDVDVVDAEPSRGEPGAGETGPAVAGPDASILSGLADTAWLHAQDQEDEDASVRAAPAVADAGDYAPTLPAAEPTPTDPAAAHAIEAEVGARDPQAVALAEQAPDGRIEPEFEPGFVRQARRRERWARPWVRALLGLALVVLALAGAAQAAWIWRDTLAQRWPASRPLLAAVCEATGCRLAPPRRPQDLVIDASSMSPSGPSRLHLEVSLHNRGAYAVAYPWLELSLSSGGDDDRLLARKVIAPEQYLSALGMDQRQVRSRLMAGLAPASRLHVRLDLALHDGQAASYTVYLFYP